jgi:carbon-monoxide dehydrogenase medium subunit
MKLPAFDYASPDTVQEAVRLLAAHPDEAKLIAGGQSLLPTMAYRLAQPRLLVDLGRIKGLAGIDISESGICIGARTRWVDIDRDPRLAQAHPLLVEAIRHVAHYQVKNRGTVGGSLAHADPAAELPGIAVACDAVMRVAGPGRERLIKADDFFVGPLSTSLAHDELILDIQFPAWPKDRRWAFQEFSRRDGDFALAGIALFHDLDAAGRLRHVHIGAIGACQRPSRLSGAEAVLEGHPPEDSIIERACQAAQEEVDPTDDIHASAAYRRSLTATLLRRALRQSTGPRGSTLPPSHENRL